MLKFLLIYILFSVCVISQTEEINEELKDKFEQFIVEYDREYENDNEKAIRFTHFVNNVRKAEELNKKYGEGQFGITKFSDWTKEELKRLHGYKPVQNTIVENLMPLHKFNQGPAPEAWDWRQHNAVTPVKNQGKYCGSCWIFSAIETLFNFNLSLRFNGPIRTLISSQCSNAIENIEGQYALKHNKLVSFSEQQLVDCVYVKYETPTYKVNGCAGGYPRIVFDYLMKSGKLVETEDAYPYIAKGQPIQPCKYNKQNGIAKVIGYNFINATNDELLKQALYEYGPLSFGMNDGLLPFFKGKILPACINNQPNHALLLVGYGTTAAGEEYWIVKNSWGANWNSDGYFKMKRGNNICNILNVGQIMTSQVE